MEKYFNINHKNSFTAVNLFSSAVCTLNCKYCFIPKTEPMKFLHQELVRCLKNKTLVNNLKKIYGTNLKHLGFWGAEPTITLKDITKIIPEIIRTFPKLEMIDFSTSLLTKPNYIIDFIDLLAKQKKRLKIEIQISVDGPAFITDVNRIKGASKKVPENFYKIIKEINKIELDKLEINFRIKSTFTIDNIRMLNKNSQLTKQYFKYFYQIGKEFKKINKKKEVSFENSFPPTLCLPGKYTSDDGRELAIFFKNLAKIDYLSSHHIRIKEILDFINNSFVKISSPTCSGGKSTIGLGIKDDLHACHRSFFLNHKEYSESISQDKKIENWDVSSFEKGNIGLLVDKFIVNINDEKEVIRWQYVMRNYHDFNRLRINYVIAIVKELALCGQASNQYLVDNKLCMAFAIFISSVLASCPLESLLNVGSLYFPPLSVIRLFSNGAFSELLKQFSKNEF